MSWKDSLRTASWRGLEFHVESHDAAFGRRQVTHEFAQRDEPFTEDLGRRARTYTVAAYLIGDDYPARRDRLIEACETLGPGELVHPYLGNMQVECTGLAVRESVSDMRMCRLQITFVEAGQARYPTNVTDSVRAVSAGAIRTQAAARGGFLERFTTDGFPSFVLDGAASRVQHLSSVLNNLTTNPMGEAQAVAGFFDRVRALADNALRLVTAPADLANEVVGIIHSVRDVFGSRSDTVLRTLRDTHADPYSGDTSTPNRRQQKANQDALSALVRRAALAEQAVAAVVTAEESGRAVAVRDNDVSPSRPGLFQTREDAIAVRDEITDAIDAEAEDPTTTTGEFQALDILRAEVVRGVPSRELRLPRVAEVVPAATLPSLVVSHQVYGTAARAVEIAERNSARHPGFLPGGKPLQVVTDG